MDKLLEYKRKWIQHVNRMPRNTLPRVMKHYSPTGKRNHGRPLKRLLDTWDPNGSTSGPTPWHIDDDHTPIYFGLSYCFYKVCKNDRKTVRWTRTSVCPPASKTKFWNLVLGDKTRSSHTNLISVQLPNIICTLLNTAFFKLFFLAYH